MRNIPNSFEFEGLLCFPGKMASLTAAPTYFFLPLRADIVRSDSGQPMVSLIGMGSMGYLMFTAIWSAPDRALEALRVEIARRIQISDPSTIQLVLAPVQVARCDLLLGDGSGQFQVIGTSTTSGAYPYSALFNSVLTEEQFAGAAAAINGNTGRLVVEYEVALITPVTAGARLIPLSSRFVTWLRPYLGSGPNGIRAALQEAIEEGLAAVQLDLMEQPSEQMVSVLYERVLTRSVEVLPKLIGAGDINSIIELEVSVSMVEEMRQSFRPRIDLAALDLRQSRVTITGAGGAEERTEKKAPPRQIKLGFDPAGAPLAWVRLQSGAAEVVLKPPQFGPANLPGGAAAQPLRVTAGYSDGAPTFKKELAAAGDIAIVLKPKDLGLASLVIDGRPLAAAGARSAKVWLSYGPPHRQTALQYTLSFGNDEWAAHLWLAAPTPAWLRYLNYRWQVVCEDGRLINQSAAYSGSSDIVLSISGEKTNVTN